MYSSNLTELKLFVIVLCTSIHSAAPTESTAFKEMSGVVRLLNDSLSRFLLVNQNRARRDHCCLIPELMTLMSRFAYKWLPLVLII